MSALGDQFRTFGDQLDDMMKQVNETLKGSFTKDKKTDHGPWAHIKLLEEILEVQKQILQEIVKANRRNHVD